MWLSRVTVCNFRLLREVEIPLDNKITLLVGRNNSGKTTLAEVFARFLQPSQPNFTIADFSSECYPEFLEAWNAYAEGNEEEAREHLPEISLTMEISYSNDLPEYGPLAAAIVDLDIDCTTALIRCSYSLQGGRLSELFADVRNNKTAGQEMPLEDLIKIIRDPVQRLYSRQITAIDPNDAENTRKLDIEALRRIITVDFLKAQRGLDDEKERPKDLIGKIFQNLFNTAFTTDVGNTQKDTADEIARAIADIEQELSNKVNTVFGRIIPALREFGYPGFNDPGITTETTLDVERVLGNHTSIRYRGIAGISFPESYNGLGSRNLILMLLTLLGYYREYVRRGAQPALHLVFIEEPEAHLHPQMQEVFITELSKLPELFLKIDGNVKNWWPQFAVSTHSSHIVNRADFSNIRYFRVENCPTGEFGRHSTVLNLTDAECLDKEFLHKYLTLTRSDLFFADKAILVEGMSERLIVSAVLRNNPQQSGSQYISLLEVGGAYSHLFFPLLDFLGIPTLIITDIDAVGRNDEDKRERATIVHEGTSTSNATIKHWFKGDKTQKPTELLKAARKKAIICGNRYLAFQVPEETEGKDGPCGRTFEEAFILANPDVSEELSLTGDIKQDEILIRDAVSGIKKSDFALRFAVEESGWVTPRYIQEGLSWLLNYSAGNENSGQFSA